MNAEQQEQVRHAIASLRPHSPEQAAAVEALVESESRLREACQQAIESLRQIEPVSMCNTMAEKLLVAAISQEAP